MRIRLSALAGLVGVAIIAVPWVGRAQSFGMLRFEQYLEALRLQAGLPGLSAAIVQDRTLAWERGFGEADLERSIAATPSTPYPIAGLTATLSAVEALRCVEQGLLTLDEPVTRFFPAFPEQGTTLRQVLAHLYLDGHFAYDLARYDAVAAGIKVCTNKTLRAAMTDGVLDRFAMIDAVPGHDFSGWSSSTLDQFPPAAVQRYASVMSRLAKPYRSDGRGRPTPTTFAPTTGLTGASGVVASVRDLARFQSALDAGDALRRETLAAAWSIPRLPDGRPSPHGLGWFVQVYEGQLVAWQFGVMPDAYSALLITLPQRGVTLILLANSEGLVVPSPLATGDISASPFARLFLKLFS